MRVHLPTILILCFLTSCFENSFLEEIPELDLEDDFSIKRIVHTEIELGTVFMDSLVTSGRTTMLLGSYADPIRGKVKASPYFEFSPESSASQIDDSKELDSLVLVLKYSGTQYDTLQTFSVNIREITEAFDYPNEDDVFYHFETLQTGKSAIASAQVQIFPAWDSVRITLPIAFGEGLFEKFKGSESILSNVDDFREAFRGLNLEVEGSSPLIELTTDTHLLFYYQERNETNRASEELKISIAGSSSSSSKTFTHLEIDRSETPFANQETKVWLPAEDTGNMALADELGQAAIGVQLGDLTGLGEIPSGYYVADAKLILPVKRNTYNSSLNPVAQSLDLYTQRKIGLFEDYLAQATIYSLDNEFQENTAYQIDATDYVDRKIRGNESDTYLWLEIMAGETLSSSYLVLGPNSSTQRPRLEIILIPLN